jgi:SAM-dependent methyltransferase
MDEQNFYDNYNRWKSWSGNPDVGLYSERYAREMRRAGLKPGSVVLELGFGDGAFLDWARDNGYNVYGVEITQACIENALKRDHRVTLGSIDNALTTFGHQFDAIVAFDVLEHINKKGLAQVFNEASEALVNGGVFITCFPNGASPFGRYYQNSDLTHETALTDGMLGQLGLTTGFEVQGAYNAARPIFGRRPYLAPFKLVLSLVRALIEILIGYTYYGQKIPLDPVMTVIMQKETKD